MLQYQKINVSEGIDVNKTSGSKECEIFHYWFFKDVGFKFEEHVCNDCHDLLTMAHSLKRIVILNAKGATFRCLLTGISKNKGLKRLNNSVTFDRGVLRIWILYQELVQYIYIYIYIYIFNICKNGWEHWFNLLSNKQEFDTK